MKTIFVSASYQHRQTLSPILDVLAECIQMKDFQPMIFVREFFFNPDDTHLMMQTAFAEIDKAHLLIAEVSYKAIGIGIEVGYAKAKAIPIIAIRHHQAEHSTTIQGTADSVLIYHDAQVLAIQFDKILEKYAQ